MTLVVVNILLALIWGAVSGSFSIPNLVLGFLVGSLALLIVREHVGSFNVIRRPLKAVALFALFFKELAVSAWSVAVLVASPRMEPKPGIFALPLDLKSDLEITLLANMITLTPGTLSIDVSDDCRTLYVHAIDASDPDALRADIAKGFERRVREAFE